jgi:hypothetical protein
MIILIVIFLKLVLFRSDYNIDEDIYTIFELDIIDNNNKLE